MVVLLAFLARFPFIVKFIFIVSMMPIVDRFVCLLLACCLSFFFDLGSSQGDTVVGSHMEVGSLRSFFFFVSILSFSHSLLLLQGPDDDETDETTEEHSDVVVKSACSLGVCVVVEEG